MSSAVTSSGLDGEREEEESGPRDGRRQDQQHEVGAGAAGLIHSERMASITAGSVLLR